MKSQLMAQMARPPDSELLEGRDLAFPHPTKKCQAVTMCRACAEFGDLIMNKTDKISTSWSCHSRVCWESRGRG